MISRLPLGRVEGMSMGGVPGPQRPLSALALACLMERGVARTAGVVVNSYWMYTNMDSDIKKTESKPLSLLK